MRAAQVFRGDVLVVALVALIFMPTFHRTIFAGGPDTGSLTVKIKPKESKGDGARWRVDGGLWQKGGETVNGLEAGDHEVSFKPTIGWKKPNNKTVAIKAGKNKKLSGKYKQETQRKTLPGGVAFDLIWIPSGSFLMGKQDGEQDGQADEIPQHEVEFASGFWMGKYEITKTQWQHVMGTTPWSGQNNVAIDDASPAIYVTWDDAQAFVAALNEHVVDTFQGPETFTLPSEAQWEYACRAGTETRYYWGDDSKYEDIDNYARYAEYAGNTEFEKYAHTVGAKTPNAWGLYDMSGNVWEWCECDYHSNYTGAPSDGSVWITPSITKIIRGSSWLDPALGPRSAQRNGSAHDTTSNATIGFRIVRSAE